MLHLTQYVLERLYCESFLYGLNGKIVFENMLFASLNIENAPEVKMHYIESKLRAQFQSRNSTDTHTKTIYCSIGDVLAVPTRQLLCPLCYCLKWNFVRIHAFVHVHKTERCAPGIFNASRECVCVRVCVCTPEQVHNRAPFEAKWK